MATHIYTKRMPKGQTISLYQGDLTEEAVDAIVNAANQHLAHGAGLAGAIVAKGGQIIQEESLRIGRVFVGNAAITTAGDLPCRFVIHAVGPRLGEGDEETKLESAVLNALLLAETKEFKSVALPAISSGIFGYPKAGCAEVSVRQAIRFCDEHPNSHLQDIRFTLIDDETVGVFKAEFERRWEGQLEAGVGAAPPAPAI